MNLPHMTVSLMFQLCIYSDFIIKLILCASFSDTYVCPFTFKVSAMYLSVSLVTSIAVPDSYPCQSRSRQFSVEVKDKRTGHNTEG